jgi:hypothetical protein
VRTELCAPGQNLTTVYSCYQAENVVKNQDKVVDLPLSRLPKNYFKSPEDSEDEVLPVGIRGTSRSQSAALHGQSQHLQDPSNDPTSIREIMQNIVQEEEQVEQMLS